MSKLEKNFRLDQSYPRLNDGVLNGVEATDIARLLEENRSLRQMAAEILLESDRLRQKLSKQIGLH